MTFFEVIEQLKRKEFHPTYLVVGEEPFQEQETLRILKKLLVTDSTFQYERFDGDEHEASEIFNALKTFSLFSDGNEQKLVYCSNFDKVAPSEIARFESYFEEPLPTNHFLVSATKVDKRKAWYKKIEKCGPVIETKEPYEREWPKWQNYLMARLQKTIEPRAFQYVVESGERKLSLVASELTKVALYVGDRREITEKDVLTAIKGNEFIDVFSFVDDVVQKRQAESIRKLVLLGRTEENEVKLLSLLIRQFRLVEHYQSLSKQGERDSKVLAGKLGVPFFVVNSIANQSHRHSEESLLRALSLLAESDYNIKTGRGNLFENFLLPYFN